MDSSIFQYVTMATAIGGLLGTGVGYQRLQRERLRTQQRAHEDGVILAESPKGQDYVAKASDVARCVGTLSMSSLYGMLVYPLVPPVFLPFVVRKDMDRD